MAFVDADLAGDKEDTKSSTGGYVVLVGPGTWFPLTWVYHKQGATSRSTTEAETSALAHCLIQECYPIWDLLELILGRKIIIRVKEDNQATIKVIRKGYSAKLAPLLRTQKINLSLIHI